MTVSRRTGWVIVAAVIGLAGLTGWLFAHPGPPGQATGLEALAVGEMAELVVPYSPALATERPFLDTQGRSLTLADFRGQIIVVNLWATWCAPCLAEMPTLAALARSYADDPVVRVLPISVDVPAQRDRAVGFMADQAPLGFYNDPTFQLPFEFGARGGMPQTILLDRQGQVRAVLTGGADWSGPEARALIEALKSEP